MPNQMEPSRWIIAGNVVVSEIMADLVLQHFFVGPTVL
jgi:hypothetical protein